jgi:ribosomal protein S27E
MGKIVQDAGPGPGSAPGHFEAVRFGVFFWPALNAYPHLGGTGFVICDECGTKNISACFHRGAIDICVSCAKSIVDFHGGEGLRKTEGVVSSDDSVDHVF